METALELAKKKGYTPIFACECSENSDSLVKLPSYVVVCDYSLIFFSKFPIKEKNNFMWMSLNQLTEENQTIAMTFDKKTVKITPKDFDEFFSVVKHVLVQLFTEDELYGINGKIFLGLSEIHSPKAALIRYSEFSQISGKIVAPSNIETLSNKLETRPSTLDFTIFSDPFYIIPTILEGIQVCPYIKELVMDDCDTDMMFELCQNLGNLLSCYDNLIFKAKTTTKFKEFCKSLLAADAASQLTGLTFQTTDFKTKDLIEIANLYKIRKMTSLGFSDASFESYEYLENEFFQSEIKETLRFLSFKNTPLLSWKININKLLPKLNYISVLSFENCGIELSDLLINISDLKMSNLKVLNLSGNKAVHMPIDGFELPANLQSIILNDVIWTENTLRNLMRRILSHPLIRKLSVINANVSEKEWHSISNLFKKSSVTQMQSLIWNNNPVTESFMDFVSNNKYLEYLSLCGTFNSYQSKIAALLVRYLNKKPSLITLIIRGSATNFLGKLTHTIVKSALGCPHLENLDISWNMINDKCTTQLQEVYTTKSAIRTFNFEGTSAHFFASLKDTLRLAAENETIRTNIPFEDIKRFVKDKQLSQNEADEIVNSFRRSPKTKGKVTYKDIDKSPFSAPFTYYADKYTTEFPNYITRREAINFEPDEETETIFTTVATEEETVAEESESRTKSTFSKTEEDIVVVNPIPSFDKPQRQQPPSLHSSQISSQRSESSSSMRQEPSTPASAQERGIPLRRPQRYPNLRVETGEKISEIESKSSQSSLKKSSERSSRNVPDVEASLQSDDSELLKTIDDELIIPQIEAQSKNRNGFVKRKDKIRFPVYLHDL